MRELDSVADRIRQHRQVSVFPVVIVEGTDDLKVLKEVLGDVDIFPADGKPNVLSATRTLHAVRFEKFAGVVDADFDDPNDAADLEERLVYYEMRDLEAMLIALGGLEKLLGHLGSQGKLTDAGGAGEVVQRLVANALPAASIRAENSAQGWGICFDDVDISEKIDRSDLSLSVERYVTALLRDRFEPLHRDVVAAASQSLPDGRGPRGKDILAFAGVGLKRHFGTARQGECSERVLAAVLLSGAGLSLVRSQWLANLIARLES